MVTVNNAHGLSLALAHAAGQAAGVHAPHGALLLAALAAGGCLAYRVSLWLHPFRLCRRCGGSGVVSGFFPGSRAHCGWCDRGLVPRLGTRLLGLRGRGPR